MYCQLDEQVIIWEKEIIHSCPYFKIRTVALRMFGTLIVGDNLLFQVQNTYKACNMDIIATTEGLFLSLDSQAQFLETSIIEPDMKNHFMIAELDNRRNINSFN